MNEITFPAGEYYLGDICYCFAHGTESWRELLDSCKSFNDSVGILNNTKVLGFHTKYGDGSYDDNEGHSYGVDSGLIGLVPIELIEDNSTFRQNSECGRIVKFEEEFKCSNNDGRLYFGDITIETDEDFEEWDEDDEYCYPIFGWEDSEEYNDYE